MPRMREKDRTKEQLIKEVADLRRRIVELERAETERKQAEGALRESEEGLEAIFNEVRDGIVLLDLTGKIIKINKRITEATGYTEKYIIGKRFNFFKNFTSTSIAKMIFNFSKAVASQQVSPFEVEGYTKTGEKRIGEIYGSLLRKKGKAAGVLVVMTDITERKQAEEALRESERRYRTLVDNIDLAINLIDADRNIVMVNAVHSRDFKRPISEVIGKKCFREFEKRDAVCPHCPGSQTIVTGQPAEAETEGVRDDGSRFQVRLQTFPIFGQDGKVTAFIEVAEDISERKRMEEALRESEKKYRTILETMEDGYFEVDLRGNLTFFNEALCRIHGRSPDEMISLDNRQFTSPETAKRIYAIFNKVYRTGIPATIVDYEIMRKDGSMAMIEESASLLRNAAGEPIGFYGVSRDRTEQKRAEEALRQSEEKYRTILEDIEEGYYEVDLAGNFTFFNDSLCRIYGYTRDELMEMNNRAYMSPETAKKTYRLFNKVYKTGEPSKIFDWEFIKKDGSTITMEISVSLIKDSQGNAVGFRGIVRDITERRQAEDALRQSEESYRNVLALAPDSVTISRIEDGRYLQVNDAFCQHTGYTPEEAIGRTAFNLNIFVDHADRGRLLEAVQQHGRAEGLEIRFRTKDGTILDDLVSARPIRFQSEDCLIVVATNVNALKKAQESLRQSEERYRDILKNIEDAYYEVDLAGNYTFFNEATCKHHGRTREELMGRNYQEHTSPETAKRIQSIFTEVYRTGIPATGVENEVIRKDGSTKLVEISVSLLRNASGEPIGFRGISRDRTQQRKAEEALRQSEEKYRTILENIDDGYYEVDLAGNFTFFNEALCRIHRRSPDEMMGLNNREYTTPETAKRIYAIFNKAYRTGIPAKIVDYEIMRKDDSVAMIEESASLLRNAAGEPIGFYGVSRDRTEQKRAEEALRQSEEKYRTILEDIEEGYYEVDLAGNFTFFNDSLCKIQGYTRDELMGMNNREYMDKETVKRVYKIFNTVFRTGKGAKIHDWHIIRKDGSKRAVEASVSLIRDAEGKKTGFRGVIRDITERKRAEEELQYTATHDALTGLPNRALFNDRLSLALTQADRNKKKLAVMLLDLDYFKDVNDTMGHSMGDQLLRVVGNRLTELLRKGDTVARVGGDEFLLLLSEIARIKDANIIAQKILETFRKPFVLDDHEIMITTSIGIAIYPDDGADAHTLMKHADVAMYRAKDKGRDNFQRYTPA